jgi:hypothetical protein
VCFPLFQQRSTEHLKKKPVGNYSLKLMKVPQFCKKAGLILTKTGLICKKLLDFDKNQQLC